MVEPSHQVLNCTCVFEKTDRYGTVMSKQVIKKACIEMGRNQFGDIVLKLSYPEGFQGPYTIRDYKIFKNFIQEGKATIKLNTQHIQLMLSNCPTVQLKAFLKCLLLKITARGSKQGIKRHVSGDDVSTQFNEISPPNTKDLELARKNYTSGKVTGINKENESITTTPQRLRTNSKPLKRKLCEIQSSSDSMANITLNNNIVTRKEDISPPPPKKLSLLTTNTSPLTEEQSQVINIIKNDHNVFITGSAGTGKSYLLQRIIGMLPPDTTYCTASTGAAASLIGGTTLHSFAGIGTGSSSLEQCVSLASKENKAIHWKRCKILVIDEISMIDGEYFDKLEAVARAVRKINKPFGGIQLVLCGDFLQLPPVCKDGNKRVFAFQAKSWEKCVHGSVELTDIHRQNDSQFIAVLQNIRIGRCPQGVTKLLQNTEKQSIEKGGIKPTKLYTHTTEVNTTNQKELKALIGEERTYTSIDSHPDCVKQLDALCPVPSILILKVGAQVMIAKNIDVRKGLVNGARAIITSFDSQGLPIVQFTSGHKEVINIEKWTFRVGGGNILSRKQLPLKLAWAMSIHKSQGMTLDCVEISLSGVFEKGQTYVALSRAKSLKSVRVTGFNTSCVQADQDVLEYYKFLRQIRRKTIKE